MESERRVKKCFVLTIRRPRGFYRWIMILTIFSINVIKTWFFSMLIMRIQWKFIYIKSLFSRCGSYVKMYLPDSLKLPNQPTPPADACILHEVNDIFRVFVFRGVTGGAMGQTLR